MKTKNLIVILLTISFIAAGQSIWAGGAQEPGKAEEAAPSMSDGPYQVYSEEAFNGAADKKRVLFFHASWCPNCINADKDITASADAVPDDVVIFKANYDSEDGLKKKYGITSQHTFVYVDSSGDVIEKWSGGNTLKILEKVGG